MNKSDFTRKDRENKYSHTSRRRERTSEFDLRKKSFLESFWSNRCFYGADDGISFLNHQFFHLIPVTKVSGRGSEHTGGPFT